MRAYLVILLLLAAMFGGLAMATRAAIAGGDAGPTVAAAEPAAAVVVVPGQTAESIAADPAGLLSRLAVAIKDGDYRQLAALVLIGLMAAFTRLGRHRIKWFAGDRGGTVAVFGLSFVGAVATHLLGEEPITVGMFGAAFWVGVIAIGMYTGIKKILVPKDGKPWVPARVGDLIDRLTKPKG